MPIIPRPVISPMAKTATLQAVASIRTQVVNQNHAFIRGYRGRRGNPSFLRGQRFFFRRVKIFLTWTENVLFFLFKEFQTFEIDKNTVNK